jgi:transposase-like protein
MKMGYCQQCKSQQAVRWSAALRRWICHRCGSQSVTGVHDEKKYFKGGR